MKYMSIETRLLFITLVDDLSLLMDLMVHQEVMKPTPELQLIRKNYKELKMELTEPFRKNNIEIKEVKKDDKD